MLKKLLVVLDVLLLAGATALGLQLHRIWTEPAPAAAAPATAPAAAAEPPAAAAATRPPGPSAMAYGVIAERNLFSPTRTEAAPEPPRATAATVAATGVPVRPAEKPRLFGVVIGADGGARAYLWDPQTKRVFGYKVGDSLADNRVEQITNDRVTLRRGTDVYDVLLRDPSKPKPPPSAQAAVPTMPPQAPGFAQPGVPPQAPGFAQPGVPGTEGVPGMPPIPGQTVLPGQPPFGTPGAPQRPFPIIPGGRPVRPVPPGSVPAPTQQPPSEDSGS
jgi:hypothetical protein